jgi:hypothetical protein
MLGVEANVDVIIPILPIPIPVPVPSVSYSMAETRTTVVNRVHYKSAILKSITGSKQRSSLQTTTKAFDPSTGRALLKATETPFAKDNLEYAQPAYWSYPQMGPAYINAGAALTLEKAVVQNIPFALSAAEAAAGLEPEYYSLLFISAIPTSVTVGPNPLVAPGDELIFTKLDGGSVRGSVIEHVTKDGQLYAHLETPMAPCAAGVDLCVGPVAYIVRSRNRNLLDADKGNLVLLKDRRPDAYRDVIPQSPWSCNTGVNLGCDSAISWSKPLVINPSARALIDLLPHLRSHDKFGAQKKAPSCQSSVNDFAAGQAYTWRKGPNGKSAQECMVALFARDGSVITPQAVKGILGIRIDLKGGPKPKVAVKQARLNYKGLAVDIAMAGAKKPVRGYLFANFDGWTSTAQRASLPINPCKKPTIVFAGRFGKLSDVLKATASTWDDLWPLQHSHELNLTEQQTSIYRAKSPFGRGMQGTWRQSEFFDFVARRRSSNPVQADYDGVIEVSGPKGVTTTQIDRFNWASPSPSKCVPQWQSNRRVTAYTPGGIEREDADAEGVKSNALYGFGGGLPLLVGKNGGHGEFGFEGFEEFSASERIDLPFATSGNIDFFTDTTFTFASARAPSRSQRTFYLVNKGVAQPMDPRAGSSGTRSVQMPSSLQLRLDPRCIPTKGDKPPRLITYPVRGGNADTGMLVLDRAIAPDGRIPGAAPPPPPRPPQPGPPDPGDWGLPTEICITPGIIDLPKEPAPIVIIAKGSVRVSTRYAHTGSKSLAILQDIEFPQTRLSLVPGKNYVVSAWISRGLNTADLSHVSDGNPPSISFYQADSTGSYDEPCHPAGPVIEGWQRAECAFTVKTVAEPVLSLRLLRGGGPADAWTYFDDIRLFPADGGVKAFVYDKTDSRLSAILDENNVATQYVYRDSGILHQIRKETIGGWRTVRETRAHTREKP